ncbi:YbdK family carboxylate-amine ligase [Paraburkholderia caribensis]|uniref:Putative glutamate--cysteine ligase 2 n=1 Tax=Paraburkholderia caribensis TaxID=75105 RepID=A0A9Q6WMY5_9BURK|nr:YbdK family carboxylate-amine ligase [Paraburkholderia caribensis]ALP66215.1 gamma-glutamyl ligase [Paraburkholderia caribensis]AMV45788.1 gamma-glutamyl ligase [Paraburkholderia caribensis]AUT54853.1 glutamate--cysteine ligase [Paraburkholderia caribensis]MCO4877249.1 YbdK family carboxylate-amine ligase [Paraburkholderia caribensis]MDR6383731.1 carboxylate-amine ligase [Paraburkholderia caribensis]
MLQPFASSDPFTMGVELEVQVVNTHDYNLTKAATELLNRVSEQSFAGAIKPETTEGMIELSTGICQNFDQARRELQGLRDTLVRAADFLNVGVCGGGTNFFQNWYDQRSDGRERSEYLMGLYGALYQQFTIFGQHVHVGCPDPDSALVLLHSLSRYVPHFIALAASSPYVQGSDTKFQCARLNSVAPFPLSGRAPFVTTWSEFEAYFERMAKTGLVNSLKDFYWDIRPSPGYGTIEIRVMDTPLRIEWAAAIAAYIQAVARYLLVDKPVHLSERDYEVYRTNRFMACRYGLDGLCVNPETGHRGPIRDDILVTLDAVAEHARILGAEEGIDIVRRTVTEGVSDAMWLRRIYGVHNSLHEVARQQCQVWRGAQMPA